MSSKLSDDQLVGLRELLRADQILALEMELVQERRRSLDLRLQLFRVGVERTHGISGKWTVNHETGQITSADSSEDAGMGSGNDRN